MNFLKNYIRTTKYTLMSFVQEQDNEMSQTMAAEKTTVQKSMMAKFGA